MRILVCLLLLANTLLAGSLEPPSSTPSPTMHTLEEIYNKVSFLGPAQVLSATSSVLQAGYYDESTLDAIDSDLRPENIRAGVTIFGITGTYECPYVPVISNGMALIPAGVNEGVDPDFGPYSLTNEAPFYMDQYEVTYELWQSVYNWATNNGYSIWEDGRGKAGDHPVWLYGSVNWYSAVMWCNARSEMEGKTPCYTSTGQVYRAGIWVPVNCHFTAHGYRLPSEIEWEYAARGGSSSYRFPWGDEINHDHANYSACGTCFTYDTSPYAESTYYPDYNDDVMPFTSPVGSFAPNGYGLYDMAGNMTEWCWDVPDANGLRMFRGGSYQWSASGCRVGYRHPKVSADYENINLGFRTVLPATE